MIRGISRCIAPVALFLLIGSFACASAVSEQQTGDSPSHSVEDDGFPLEVTDARGTTVTIESRPHSVVSLSLFTDEVLFELLTAERFPAVTGLAVDPVYSNVAEAASAVEQRVEFNVERLIDIFPDVVFAASWSEADKVSQLRDAGIVVYQAETPVTIGGIAAEIRTLARIVGAPDGGEALVSDMHERIDALTRVVEAIPESERVESVDYSNWGTASGRDTTWSEVLRLSGVENAAAPYETGDYGQVPMSKELIRSLAWARAAAPYE